MNFRHYLEEIDHVGYNIGPVFHGGAWNGVSTALTRKGALGAGVYFTPEKEIAISYAKESKGILIEAYLKINKPLVIHSDNNSIHPCVELLVQLGVPLQKARDKVEKIEEKYGYMGNEIRKLAEPQGYDGILQYRQNKISEAVIWYPYSQIKVVNTEKL